jgi:UDP-2-acetamido-3-amino-2,3-dideoxy-glucuronate N-acetyltransferase
MKAKLKTKSFVPQPAWAHASAVVDEGAEMGAGTKVWHFSHVMSGARIGVRCSLGQNVFVGATVVIGDGCKIQNNVSLYDGVVLEDDVFVGPSAVFTNVVNPRAFIVRKDEYRRTVVARGASIGANATIVCGHDVGHHAFVAAGAVVTRTVAPYALVAGVPARRIGWMCLCGTSLPRGTGARLACTACGRAYRRKGRGSAQTLAEERPGGVGKQRRTVARRPGADLV